MTIETIVTIEMVADNNWPSQHIGLIKNRAQILHNKRIICIFVEKYEIK